MQTSTVIRPLAAAILAGLAFAACGAEEPAAETAADREQQRQDAQLAFARCMREHGIEMPDPEPGERGLRLVSPEGTSPEQMGEAEEACRKHLDDAAPPELSEEQEQQAREAALAHARCMREHGIDMPDPTFGEDGRIQMRLERGRVDPDDPDFQAAQEACRDELPDLGAGPEEGSP